LPCQLRRAFDFLSDAGVSLAAPMVRSHRRASVRVESAPPFFNLWAGSVMLREGCDWGRRVLL